MREDKPKDISVTVVVPVRNEEKNIPELVRRLTGTLDSMCKSHDIIFVTDRNTDRTFDVLKQCHAEDSRVKAIKLSIGRGQHIAAVAGLDVAEGDFVVLMDGDLQDYPEDIPKLYERIQQGYDIVYGVKERKNDSALRNFLSRSFVRVMDFLSDYSIEHNTSMFRMVTRRTVLELRKYRENEQPLMGLFSLVGFPSDRVLVTSGVRMAGETKYSMWRQIEFAIGFILAFSTRPLRYISYLGCLIALLSFFYFLYAIMRWAAGTPMEGWTSIIGLITLLGGIQILCMGIISEYLARIYIESKGRPLYTVEEMVEERGASRQRPARKRTA